MKDWRIKLDFTMTVAIALTAIIALCSCRSGRATDVEAPEATYQPTTVATTQEATEATTEPVETEPPVTEPTEATEPTETVPPVILYDVPLDADLQLHIIDTAEAYGIDPAIIFAIAHRETRCRPELVGDGGNSLGLMQVQPRWHSERMERLDCPNLLDPFQNVTVAVDYLDEMLGWYGGDMAKALTAYNRGSYEGTVTEYATAVLNIAEELRCSTYVFG